jgi:hypothetical protein
MNIEKGMILSSLLTLSSPLVSFLKNSKMAPVPVAWGGELPPALLALAVLLGSALEAA